MTREDVLRSPVYWATFTQTALYNCAERYMEENGINRTELARRLGVSKGYVTQLLGGDYDHKMSKFFELALAFGYVPRVEFVPLRDVLEKDATSSSSGEWAVIGDTPTAAA